jgi:hypothetical protein
MWYGFPYTPAVWGYPTGFYPTWGVGGYPAPGPYYWYGPWYWGWLP